MIWGMAKRPKYAEGGKIPSGGGPRDDRMVSLDNGFAVVSESARKRYGSEFFARLNGGAEVYTAEEVLDAMDSADD
jgi:hypothetical protein